MPRLLIITTVPATLRAFLLPYARHFGALGWRVDAMARGASACSECRAAFHRTWDVEWTRNPCDIFSLLRSVRQVRAVVEAEGYDLVHVHTPIAAFVARAALRRIRQSGRVKVIYTAHGFHFHSRRGAMGNAVFGALERCAGRWTDELVVINREDALAAQRLQIVPPEHIHYMTGIGVDTERYHPGRVAGAEVDAVRAELGHSAGTPLFLVLGEFIRRKRHRDVIEALARLSDPRPHLALAGDGPLLETVRAQALRLGVADRVHLLGFRRDVPALVRASSAVVLVSAQEGLPRSVLEALCLETPVIGSDIRGNRELLEDGAGWLVPPGNTEQIAHAMAAVISSPDEARERGCRGRLKVLDGYDQASIVRRHELLYARALEPREAPPLGASREGARQLKRAIDLVAALGGLIILSPLLAVLALAIRLNMGSPVFFRQRRPGLDGAPFELVKFRTMRAASGPDGRPLPDAQRLTPLGRALRATSLDELPQLWNVLKGELSLVGPRPLLMEYLALYTPDQARRHEVRPGITGWAQVNGRNALSWEQKFAHDVWYIDHWSIRLDLKILGLTFLKVLRRDGVSAAGEATATPFRRTHQSRPSLREGTPHKNLTTEEATACKPSG
jgi:lipopolysaccharide/colanic/teichoic acid biosynthesis glycosyltransferase/glycosyltransferase involved in cell wall biosynthesis